MRKLSIYLTQRQHDFLEEMSGEMGVTISDLIRRALDRYIRRETRRG